MTGVEVYVAEAAQSLAIGWIARQDVGKRVTRLFVIRRVERGKVQCEVAVAIPYRNIVRMAFGLLLGLEHHRADLRPIGKRGMVTRHRHRRMAGRKSHWSR